MLVCPACGAGNCSWNVASLCSFGAAAALLFQLAYSIRRALEVTATMNPTNDASKIANTASIWTWPTQRAHKYVFTSASMMLWFSSAWMAWALVTILQRKWKQNINRGGEICLPDHKTSEQSRWWVQIDKWHSTKLNVSWLHMLPNVHLSHNVEQFKMCAKFFSIEHETETIPCGFLQKQ